MRCMYGKETRHSVQFTSSLVGKPQFIAERGEEIAGRSTAKEGLFVMAVYAAVLVVFVDEFVLRFDGALA